MELTQPSLTGGEISPGLYGRVDLARYQTSLRRLENCIVRATGGVSNRAGTEYVNNCLSNTADASILIPFVVSNDQAYVIEMSNAQARSYRDAAVVQTISAPYSSADLPDLGYTQSADVMTLTHGDHVPHELERLTPTTFQIDSISFDDGPFLDGNIDRTSFVYASANLGTVNLVATAGIFASTHVGALMKLEEESGGNIEPWAANQQLASGGTSILGEIRRSDGKVYRCVTDGTAIVGKDWFTGTSAPVHTSGVYWDGAQSSIDDNQYGAQWEYLHSGFGIVRITSVTDSKHATATVLRRLPDAVVGGATTANGPWTMTGDGSDKTLATAGATSYNKYDYEVTYGGVIQSQDLYEVDAGADVLTFYTAPANGVAVSARELSPNNRTSIWAFGAWSEDQGYPSSATYYQDRLVFAATTGQPQTEWASRTGKYHEFLPSVPIVNSDPLAQTLNARQINDIRDLVPLDQLISITATAAYASPQRGQAWTPETIGFTPQTNLGGASVRSIIVDESALFTETHSTRIHNLNYTFQEDKFKSSELTLLARHLFDSEHSITWMAYQAVPYNIVWVGRSDGVLCSVTYLPSQEVIGWARHITDGIVEHGCVIPENGQDTLYLIVRREINGSTVRFIERMKPRDVANELDHFFVDAGLTYDGRNTGATTMTLSGASWELDDLVTLTASASTFASGDVADEIHFPYVDDEGNDRTLRVELTTYVSATVFTVRLLFPAPSSLQGIATTDWGFARDTFSGLGHLEGEEVAIQVDGGTEANQTVIAGAITIPTPAVVVHAGLPFTALLETLDINLATPGGTRTLPKNIPRVSLFVEKTAVFKAGPDEDNLNEYGSRTDETYGDAPRLSTEISDPLYIPCNWNKSGRVVIQQAEAASLTVLSIHPEVEFGDSG